MSEIFYVTADVAVLELDLGTLGTELNIINDVNNPASVICLILPELPSGSNYQELHWHRRTSLSGPPADLILLIRSDLHITREDFSQFPNVLISDNQFHQDGSRFIAIDEGKHANHQVTLEDCKAANVYFLCNSLSWLGGTTNTLYAALHGNNSSLELEGTGKALKIGDLIIPEDSRPYNMFLKRVNIQGDLLCDVRGVLQLKEVYVEGKISRLSAMEIKGLSDFRSESEELLIKVEETAVISPFLMPRGKIVIDVGCFLDFKADGKGNFSGIDLYLDISKALEKKLTLPSGSVIFDKVFIKGAELLDIPGSIKAVQMELINCINVCLNETSVEHLKYETNGTSKGRLVFGDNRAGSTFVSSLWLIGSNDITFYGTAEVLDVESEGRCHLSIYGSFKGNIVKLNLNLDPKTDKIKSTNDGYIGLRVTNSGDRTVEIATVLAKLSTFNISGRVKLGDVIIQPVDQLDNLIQIDLKHLNNFSINSFFAGFDHNVVIDKRTGRISLVQSMDRALIGSQIITTIHCEMKDFLTIRAGQGLSFRGEIKIIDGDIDLSTIYGKLSVFGSLRAKKQIRLAAIEGSVDLSAELNAQSIITYAKTEHYQEATIINAREILSRVAGNYIQIKSQTNTEKMAIVSENQDIMIRAASMNASILQGNARGRINLESSSLYSGEQQYSGTDINLINSRISGNTTVSATQDIRIIDSTTSGAGLTNIAQKDIIISRSSLRNDQISNYSQNASIFETRITGSMDNELTGSLEIERSQIAGKKIENHTGGQILIRDSALAGQMIINNARGNIEVSNSDVFASNMANVSGGSITVNSSQILSDGSIFFKAISNFLALESNISLAQYPYKLFVHNFGAIDSQGNPVLRCGLTLREVEVLGIIDASGYGSNAFNELQYSIINSNDIGLNIFKAISDSSPKGIFIDAYSGVIMGSKLQATGHKVIVKTKQGLELLPLAVYNAVMSGGGFNDAGIKTAITKIEAGAVDIDGGSIIRMVGALLRANTGNLKADYVITEDNVKEITARQQALRELKPWLKAPEAYDMVVNQDIVGSQLEFSEITRIDVGKGKINIFYPYKSKQVSLTQREGDIVINQNADFSRYGLMAINAEQGKVFFGIPITEYKNVGHWWGGQHMISNRTVEHVNVRAQNLIVEGSQGIEIHGVIEASGDVGLRSDKKVEITADKHNFGQALKQSVIRSNNAYVVAENIEVKGSLITVRDNLKLVSHNDVKILPVELLHRYYYCSGKTTESGSTLKQVVSQLNAGMINIDAGRATEFISALIEAEGLNVHTGDLRISSAREIFEKQVEFRGKEKWYGGGGKYWCERNYSETVVPTVIRTDKQAIVVDHDATIEAARIFADKEILLKVGNNLTIRDGYNLHIHDYHSKKYSLASFHGGSMKIGNTRTIKDFLSGEESVPTIICTNGIFYGVVEGRMHVLGSKIIGQDIHLVVPQGLKLEASRHIDTRINFVHESGLKVGYYGKGKTEAGLVAAFYKDREKDQHQHQHLSESELFAEDSLTIIVKDGTFEQLSSHIAARVIQVEARNWVAKTYSDNVISEHLKLHLEAGLKLAARQNITKTTEKIKELINKKGTHVIDQADRVFRAYDAYKSMAALPDNATSAGLYAYAEGSEAKQLQSAAIAVDNTINGETIIARVQQDIHFHGVKMRARDVDLEAYNFEWQTSSDKYDYEYDFGQVDLEVDLLNGGKNSSFGLSNKSVESETITHHQNYLKASGNLKITLSGTGAFRGVSLEGASVDIKANDLIMESVQDRVAEKLRGSSLHIGYNHENGSIGPGFNIEDGFKKAAWTNQVARIIGSQVVNIAVKETLEIAGGLIANAQVDRNGNLTDQGNLSVNCGRIIVRTIHDYDQGVTLGIGANLQVNESEKGERSIEFANMPLKVEYKDNRREVGSVIGQGQINTGQVIGDTLRREPGSQIEVTREEQFGFDSVVHRSMFTAEQKPSIKKVLRSESGENSLAERIGHYMNDLADGIKTTGKDLALEGAKLINLFGGNIDQEKLSEKVYDLIKINPANGMNYKEEERHYNKKLGRELIEAATYGETDPLLSPEQKQQQEKVKAEEFFRQLEAIIKEAEGQERVGEQEKKTNGLKTSVMLKAYSMLLKNEHKKELDSAQKEGREAKSLEQLVKDLSLKGKFSDKELIGPSYITAALLKTYAVLKPAVSQKQSVEETTGQIVPVQKGYKKSQNNHTQKPADSPLSLIHDPLAESLQELSDVGISLKVDSTPEEHLALLADNKEEVKNNSVAQELMIGFTSGAGSSVLKHFAKFGVLKVIPGVGLALFSADAQASPGTGVVNTGVAVSQALMTGFALGASSSVLKNLAKLGALRVIPGVGVALLMYDVYNSREVILGLAKDGSNWYAKVFSGNKIKSYSDEAFLEIAQEIEYNGVFERSKHDKSKGKQTGKFKNSAISPMPDPEDFEPDDKEGTEKDKDKVRIRGKANYEIGENINLERFTQKFEKVKLRDPKSGQYIAPDRGRGSGVGGHGGSWWKLYDNEKLVGTVTKDGRLLRKRPK